MTIADDLVNEARWRADVLQPQLEELLRGSLINTHAAWYGNATHWARALLLPTTFTPCTVPGKPAMVLVVVWPRDAVVATYLGAYIVPIRFVFTCREEAERVLDKNQFELRNSRRLPEYL